MGEPADLGDLREQFRHNSFARLDRMREALGALGVVPDASDPIRALLRDFHGLAGLAATFGFAEVSRLAEDCERHCVRLHREKRAVDAGTLTEWAAIIERIAGELAAAPEDESERPPLIVP